MSCVKVGRWIFPIDNVIAIESQADGAIVKLKGGHEATLNKAQAEAFLLRFERNAVIEILDDVSDSGIGEENV